MNRRQFLGTSALLSPRRGFIHTTAEEAGRIAAEAHVGTLVLSQLIPAEDPAVTEALWSDAARRHFNGRVIVGSDLMELRSACGVRSRSSTTSLFHEAERTLTGPSMPNPADQLAALAELDRLLTANGIDYWLFGGWAVDFHVGRVTREHADIDMAVWFEDHARVATLLDDAAWLHRPEPDEDGYTSWERGSVRLEVAFLARDERGAVYTPLRSGRGAWPDDSFGNATAELGGVRARLVNKPSLIADKSVVHSDGQAAAKDRADVASLLGQREAPTAP